MNNKVHINLIDDVGGLQLLLFELLDQMFLYYIHF